SATALPPDLDRDRRREEHDHRLPLAGGHPIRPYGSPKANGQWPRRKIGLNWSNQLGGGTWLNWDLAGAGTTSATPIRKTRKSRWVPVNCWEFSLAWCSCVPFSSPWAICSDTAPRPATERKS